MLWLPFALARLHQWRPGWRLLVLVLVLLVATIVIGVLTVGQPGPARPDPAAATARLVVESAPVTATVVINDRAAGLTPLTLALPPGPQRISLQAVGWLDSPVQTVSLVAGETARLRVLLWSAAPRISPLRPPGVGQTIVEVSFIAGDRLALTITPARQPAQRELWLRAADGRLQRHGPPQPVPLLVISPDGRRVAYAVASPAATSRPAFEAGSQPRPTELWLTDQPGQPGQRRLSLVDEPGLRGATLTGLSWAPDGRHLLATALDRQVDGTPFTVLLWLSADGDWSQRLPNITGEILSVSLAWSPTGDRVALLAGRRGQATATLVVLTPAATAAIDQLHNVADIPLGAAARLPTSLVRWTPDGQALLIPWSGDSGGGLFSLGGSRSGYGLIVPGPRPPVPWPGLTGTGPGWRDATTLLTLQPSRDGQLTVLQTPIDLASLLGNRHDDPDGAQASAVATRVGTPPPARPTPLITLPLRPSGGPIGAHWESATQRLLIVTPGRLGAGDELSWWLVQW